MGCNTSKEATIPVEEENTGTKDDKQNSKDGQESVKPESAKTVTVTSNGFVLTKQEDKSENKETDKKEPTEDTGLEEAAVKIQAAFRGHQTRKSMKQPTKHEEKSSPTQNMEEEFSPADQELCEAATKIQASFRGHMIRKQIDKKENESSSSPHENKHEDEEELDIDLSDPDLNKAAVKIQASFRGHMVRKDHEDENSK